MISLKIQKTSYARFISHMDLLRNVKKTLKRAGITVLYSKGFNPHPLLNLSQPLPLGIESKAEWVQIHTDTNDAKKIVELYNNACPVGYEALEAFYTEEKPNIAGKVIASDYYIFCEKAIKVKNELESINKNSYTLSYKKNEKVVTKEASNLIYEIKVDVEGFFLRLAFGNNNLRIDRLIEKINEDFKLDIRYSEITRLNQLVQINNKFFTVEKYLEKMQ